MKGYASPKSQPPCMFEEGHSFGSGRPDANLLVPPGRRIEVTLVFLLAGWCFHRVFSSMVPLTDASSRNKAVYILLPYIEALHVWRPDMYERSTALYG